MVRSAFTCIGDNVQRGSPRFGGDRGLSHGRRYHFHYVLPDSRLDSYLESRENGWNNRINCLRYLLVCCGLLRQTDISACRSVVEHCYTIYHIRRIFGCALEGQDGHRSAAFDKRETPVSPVRSEEAQRGAADLCLVQKNPR